MPGVPEELRLHHALINAIGPIDICASKNVQLSQIHKRPGQTQGDRRGLAQTANEKCHGPLQDGQGGHQPNC